MWKQNSSLAAAGVLSPLSGVGPSACRACDLRCPGEEDEEGGGSASEEKPYKCPFCSSASHYKGNLASHRARHAGACVYLPRRKTGSPSEQVTHLPLGLVESLVFGVTAPSLNLLRTSLSEDVFPNLWNSVPLEGVSWYQNTFLR